MIFRYFFKYSAFNTEYGWKCSDFLSNASLFMRIFSKSSTIIFLWFRNLTW